MKKRVWILVAAVLLISACAVGGSLAWLADSAAITNTFTTGDIEIKLDEPNYKDPAKVYPGAEIAKDPTVTILANSEACWVLVCVENNLVIDDAIVGIPNIHSDWTPVSVQGNKTIYSYKAQIPTSANDTTLTKVFTTVTISGEQVTKENINTLEEKTITVTAYAHQAAGQTTAEALLAFEAILGGTWAAPVNP